MLVVNLFGVPGAGKTCNAHLLTGLLSVAGFDVEYCAEFARIATYQNNKVALSDQLMILGHQNHLLHTYTQNKIDIVVCDSPLPIGLLYLDENCYYKNFKPLLFEVFNSYTNLNFFLRKSVSLNHSLKGRSQSKEKALALEPKMEFILQNNNIPYIEHYTSKGVENLIYNEVFSKITRTKNQCD